MHKFVSESDSFFYVWKKVGGWVFPPMMTEATQGPLSSYVPIIDYYLDIHIICR